MSMDKGGRMTPGKLLGWFKYTLQSVAMLVYNITMTKNNVHDSDHVKIVTVYASFSVALKANFYGAARRTGEVLASAGKSIVYGTGGGGLMGSMADGALSKNGKVYGIVRSS